MGSFLSILAVFSAFASEVWQATPDRHGDPVLVVQTPGVGREGMLPLVEALRVEGHEVYVQSFGCGALDLSALSREVVEQAGVLGPEVTVLAHGLGATIALAAAPELDVRGYVLLAPVLGVWPVDALAFLAEQSVGPAVDLSEPLPWRDRDLRTVLLGPARPPLGCFPAPLAREVQRWIATGEVPLRLEAVDDPVWIAVSLGDDVAAVEVVVPASRRLPDHTLVRLGINRLNRQDYDHAEMLMHDVPVRVAARAVRRSTHAGGGSPAPSRTEPASAP